MKFEDFLGKVRPKELIEMSTDYVNKEQYLIIKVAKDGLKVLPLSQCKFSPKKTAVPLLSIPYGMIKKYLKLDHSMLLYYANSDNPHIIRTIKEMEI